MSETLAEISVKLAQIILPIIMVLGITGNSLNIIILTRANLRNHACSKYFLALASNNLIYIVFITYFLLANGYNMDGQLVSNASCKILQFITSACPFLSPYFIVLASIDRFCASSSNAKLRRFSNVVIAKWSILILVVCTLIFFINTLVLYELRDDGYGCYLRPETIYNQVFNLVQIILYAAVPPILMIIFGLLTIYNTTQLHVIPQVTMRHRRTEGQLARMLFLQVAVYIILNMPLCILYLMLILPTDFTPTLKFFYAFNIAPFPFHFSYATTFFLYILSARVYREELFRLISKVFHIRRAIQIQPISITHQRRHTEATRHQIPIIHE
ncbi:unnamed protein product [Adineta steineri]|uniref:G-protein coupled receptors family 1 profile domain-containing protein n=1 Tax=Adineta steineri TaxID=433720 RepID=A0A819B7B4_9BILA|nr:unnamed protein product [Adineta steineri]CAF3797090.1 unnamed protein product [Adineta steineri]